MPTVQEIVRALRCSAIPADESTSRYCEMCPYLTKEEIESDFPIVPDVIEGGKKYWVSCDCDRMAQDAAETLEKLMEKNNKGD